MRLPGTYISPAETGLYYLQSRYYNPEWGRFINADGFVATGQGVRGNNMFAYCLNNPVMYVDTSGHFVGTTTFIATGAIAFCAQSLLPVVGIVAVVAILCDPYVQEAIADGFEYIATTVDSWVDVLEDAITDRLSVTLTKTPENQEKKYHIHHIVAQNDPRAMQSRWILTYLFDHGVNDARNLVPVEDRIHQRLHTNTYYLFVEHIIVDAFWSAPPYKQAQIESVEKALEGLRVFILGLSAIS